MSFMRRLAPLLLLASASCGVLCACATTGSNCEQQVNTCLERCEATTDPIAQRAPAPTSALPPQNTVTVCEARCGCPHPKTTPPPQGPPTPTGTAKP
jgi:hypothetical protein